MPSVDPQRRSRVVRYYTVAHLTLRAIGRLEGISATAVLRHLRIARVSAEAGEWVEAQCPQCHKVFRRKRARWRKARQPRCSRECYFISRQNPRFRPWRHGQRLAREVVSKHFELQPTHVVHHHNGDHHDNRPSNLAVFASQSDHMRHHHTGCPAPIWDGRTLFPSEPDEQRDPPATRRLKTPLGFPRIESVWAGVVCWSAATRIRDVADSATEGPQ